MLLPQTQLWEGITPSREPRWGFIILLFHFLWCSFQRFFKAGAEQERGGSEMRSGLICCVMIPSFMLSESGGKLSRDALNGG